MNVIAVMTGMVVTLTILSGNSSYGRAGTQFENTGECVSSFISQGSSVEEAVVQSGVGGDEEEDAVADEQVGPQPIIPLEEKQEPEDDLGRPEGAVSPEGTSLNNGELVCQTHSPKITWR
jgi:hypothetical protein